MFYGLSSLSLSLFFSRSLALEKMPRPRAFALEEAAIIFLGKTTRASLASSFHFRGPEQRLTPFSPLEAREQVKGKRVDSVCKRGIKKRAPLAAVK